MSPPDHLRVEVDGRLVLVRNGDRVSYSPSTGTHRVLDAKTSPLFEDPFPELLAIESCDDALAWVAVEADDTWRQGSGALLGRPVEFLSGSADAGSAVHVSWDRDTGVVLQFRFEAPDAGFALETLRFDVVSFDVSAFPVARSDSDRLAGQ